MRKPRIALLLLGGALVALFDRQGAREPEERMLATNALQKIAPEVLQIPKDATQ